MNIDWRSIEDKVLRQAAKAKSFRELYGGGSAKRVPGQPVTGRMSVLPPPDHIVRLVREPNA
ncbi:hypothetical protein [Streptomyces sp. NPDC058252]|uniref:hypothetical protein n=1 Tax=Streptomyces sp. NPDC058252 TaxID=3346405 RepID=UPI0036E23814